MNFGYALGDSGDHEEAKHFIERALEIQEADGKTNPLEKAKTLRGLGDDGFCKGILGEGSRHCGKMWRILIFV